MNVPGVSPPPLWFSPHAIIPEQVLPYHLDAQGSVRDYRPFLFLHHWNVSSRVNHSAEQVLSENSDTDQDQDNPTKNFHFFAKECFEPLTEHDTG